MVLFGSYEERSARGPRQGQEIFTALDQLSRDFVFNLCKVCNTMASIPPSAFSAARIRETQRDPTDMKMSNIKKTTTRKFFENATMELNPLKYNSKLMNSIWGFYNRYSPHNVKKINDAHVFSGDLQQSAGNSTNKPESAFSLPPPANFENFWATH